jgi:hypothetical protein
MLEVVLAVTIFHCLSAIILMFGFAVAAVRAMLRRVSPMIRTYLPALASSRNTDNSELSTDLAEAA